MRKIILLLTALLIILAACARPVSTPAPTPELTELTSEPLPPAQPLAISYTPRQITDFMVDRASDGDLVWLRQQRVNTSILVFNIKAGKDYRPDWRQTLEAAKAAGMSVVAWPADWDKPRGSACGHESPFPVNAEGDISHITSLLDVLADYPQTARGIIDVHESTSNCPMTVGEMIGLKTKIVDYTTAQGHTLEVWNYVGVNKLTTYPNVYTASNIPKMMDVLLAYKYCEGRADAPCESLPGWIMADRSKLDAYGLSGQIKYVFMYATYATDYAPYNLRQTLARAEAVSKSILDTKALDGYGFYTWRAGWWAQGDLSQWPEMWPLIPYDADLAFGAATPGTATVTAIPTYTPTMQATFTPTVVASPTKTPTPVRTKTPSKTPNITPTPGAVTPYCVLVYPEATPRVEFCP